MKKFINLSSIFIALLALLSSCCCPDLTSSRTYGKPDHYDSIVVDDAIKVFFTNCEQIEAVAYNRDLDELEINVVNGTLRIESPNRDFYSNDIRVNVPFQNVKQIKLFDAACLKSINLLKSDSLNIFLDDAAIFEGSIDAPVFTVNAYDASRLYINNLYVDHDACITLYNACVFEAAGSIDSLSVDIDDASALLSKKDNRQFNLSAKRFSGIVNSLSKVKLNVSDSIDNISIDNHSKVVYSGNPAVGANVSVNNLSSLERI